MPSVDASICHGPQGRKRLAPREGGRPRARRPLRRGRGVAVQPDGKIVAAGVTIADDDRTVPALARYNPDGTLDAGFGSDGQVVAPNGRILMAGSPNGDFVVERYENAAAPPEISAVRVDAGGAL